MKMCRAVFLVVVITFFVISQPLAKAQSSSGSGTPAQSQTQTAPPPASSSSSLQLTLTYHRPSETEKLKNYAFDSFGPYAFFGAAVAGAYQQAVTTNATPHISGSPPDWGQGWDSYGVRVANNFGINLVTQTTRYGLAEVFHEDTLFYRCECDGFVPRLKHALISTITARHGDDGHRMFSFASLVAPYAGGEAAALGWYPSRYNAKDGFRIGNYNLAVQAGLNVALEFIYGGPHTFLGKHHVPVLSNATGSSQQ